MRVHFSEHIVTEVHSTKALVYSGKFKPEGLWYSIEGEGEYGWSQFCMDEDYRLEGLRYQMRLHLDLSKMLIIRTDEELHAFSIKFALDLKQNSEMQCEEVRSIDWERIVKMYSGIEIPQCLFDHWRGDRWYDTWDVACGCIWDSKVVERIELISLKGDC